ncbi:MAG: MBL fold metallo-hydrolase [Thermomicrobium sp.]|nr:MBL fold metallo-hydrolase [Thermomicrobium sp.]
MDVEIVTLPCGPLETNAYLLVADGRALLIDAPPDSLLPVLDELDRRRARLERIVITHTHWDHIVDAAKLRRETGAPIVAHPEAVPRLEQPRSLLTPLPFEIEPAPPDELVRDGDTIDFPPLRFRVIHTPGHTPEQISLYEPERRWLFGGDTLFPGGYGRVDLPGSSMEDTLRTLRRLLELPDDAVVFPGHGPTTTIGRERGWIEQLVGQRR